MNLKENDALLDQWFGRAKRNIRIVTLDGSSFISTHHDRLKTAMRHGSVQMLMVDYKDANLHALVQFAMERSQQPIKSSASYARQLNQYAQDYFHPTNNFSVGVYRSYPWIRFTIFDDSAVSFILTLL